VRIVVSEEGTSCRAVGVADRLPIEQSITLTTAARLARDGIPTVVRRTTPPEGRRAMVEG
jgi:hypothetical protein